MISLTGFNPPSTIRNVGTAQTSEFINPHSAMSRNAVIWLGIILVIAATLRLSALVSHAFVLDECWSLEIATGRGSLHLNLPVDQTITPVPPFYSLGDAPPWWHIWTHMEVTHPPLYPILLRWWEDVAGDSDYGARLFSVVASLAAIALLFDIVRLQSGLAPAVWASLLMAIAAPQVEHARLARSYTLLLAISLIAVNIMTRIQLQGITRRRSLLLAMALLATVMTHYFCIGAIIGLLIYALWALPHYRRQTLSAFILAGIIFIIIWGPWMWQQRHLFATDDPSTLFLSSNASHHSLTTFLRIFLDPVRMLFPCSGEGILGILTMIAGGALITAPFIPGLIRNNSFLVLWGLWMAGTISVIATLDFARGTDHLDFVRYTILAGPAVYALLGSLFAKLSRWRIVMHLVPAVAAVGCLIQLPDVYNHDDLDPRKLVANLLVRPGPHDLLVIAAPTKEIPVCEIYMLMLARYFEPMPGSVAILTHTATPELMNAIGEGRLVFLDTQEADYQVYFPDARLLNAQTYHGLGHFFTLQLNPNSRPKRSQ